VSFQVNSEESVVLTMIDMKGHVVFIYDLGRLLQGKNQIGLDLSSLPNGMYTCQLTNGTAKVTCKLVIDH
jgi:translation elongation factor EF-4